MNIKTKNIIIIVLAILIFIPITLLILGIGGVMWSNAHPEIGENVKTVKWLPTEATNISYYQTYSNTAYEFDISESGFKKWAERWALQPIKEPRKIERYSYFIENKNPSLAYATITNGLYYYKYDQSDCGSVHVVYDSGNGRAYFKMNPR